MHARIICKAACNSKKFNINGKRSITSPCAQFVNFKVRYLQNEDMIKITLEIAIVTLIIVLLWRDIFCNLPPIVDTVFSPRFNLKRKSR